MPNAVDQRAAVISPSHNVERAEPGWPAVVVAGAFQTGVVLMRNLARRGLKVFAFDCIPNQPGFRTVYGTTFLCPNPDTHPNDWLAFMVALAARIGGKPALIPSADQFVSAMAAHVDELERSFVFCQSGSAVQSLLATKRRQYEIAASHGLPTARTAFIQTRRDLEKFVESAQFPCLLKPLHFRDWEKLPAGHALLGTKLALADNASTLLTNYDSVVAWTPELVAQEIIEGPDTAKLVYMSCYARDGRRLGSCLVRQIRTAPINFGSASLVEPMSDPEAHQLSDSFLRSIGYQGICELELKRDARDGRVKLIEANPRYSITADAAPYAGVDIGWLHYLDLIGQPVEPVSQNNRYFRHIVLRRDAAAFRDYIRAGLLTWTGWLKSYLPPVHFFDLDIKDRRVATGTVVDVLKTLFYPVYRRLRPKRPL